MTEEQEPQTLDLERLLKAIEASGAEEVHVESGSLVIRYSRTARIAEPDRRTSVAPATTGPVCARRNTGDTVADGSVDDPTSRNDPDGGADVPVSVDGRDTWEAITAPIAGVFYHCPKPGEPPFVSIGDRVVADDPIGIIEVMKLMSTVVAGVVGTVREVAVPDAVAVGFGEPLIWVEPDA